ncbi:MAG TPA: hypothetical protein VGN12_17255 [Pirellulales bacterium]|jgi:hypothetical protein
MSTAAIHLDRLLQPQVNLLPADVASKVAALRADDATQQRIDYLAERANEGQLTTEESAEYAAYIQAIDVISVLQAKARALPTGQK